MSMREPGSVRRCRAGFARLAALALLAWLAGCAQPTTQGVSVSQAEAQAEARLQRELAFEGYLEDELRVKRVALPLLVAAADLCRDKVRFESGATFTSAEGFGRDWVDTVGDKLNVRGNQLGLLHVVPGSPADQAGLRRGDILLEVNGWTVPDSKDAGAQLSKRADEFLKKPDPVRTVYLRDGQRGRAFVRPVRVCDYMPLLAMDEQLNAFADGQRIVIFRGMLRFANDQELALVIGHELAHNAMGHIEAQSRNSMIGSLADIIAATRGVNTGGTLGQAAALKYSKDFEAEADYVGLYVVARAGLPIADAPKFWRRMAAANPQGINPRSHNTSHPATSERFIALAKTVQEIEAKKAAGQPLVPELKRPVPPAGATPGTTSPAGAR